MEEVKQDTPQQANTGYEEAKAFGAPVQEGSNEQALTIEDAFSSIKEESPAPAPENGTPEVVEETTQETEPTEAKNDERRFEYWQSQAAKRENEVQALQQQLQAAQAQPATPAEVPAQQTQPAVEEFPPPPAKPEKPRAFSRDEAWSDPSSESAKYLDEVEEWRDNMSQYSDLKNQYDLAVMQEKLDNQEKQRQEAIQRHEAQRQVARQNQEIYEHVQGHYGFNDGEAREFIQTMSDPNSITMDNLVNLYRMQKGMSPQQPAVTSGPSDTFNQVQNAQQIPSPMGVVTGETGQDTRPEGDQVMDDLIKSFNSENPWS
jgi:hypothetical protein